MVLRIAVSDLATVVDNVSSTPVLADFPDRLTPPTIIVTPSSSGDWMVPRPYDDWLINMEVLVIVERGTWEQAVPQLEQLTEPIVKEVRAKGYGIDGVSAPAIFRINNQELLATVIRVNMLTKLEGAGYGT